MPVPGIFALAYDIRRQLYEYERAFIARGWTNCKSYVIRHDARVAHVSSTDRRTMVEFLEDVTKATSLDPMAHNMAQSVKSQVDKEAMDSQVVGF